jgi:hypothetical protein
MFHFESTQAHEIEEVCVSGTQVGILAIAVVAGYLAASSRFLGTKLCPRWWERFILDHRRH